MRSEAGPLTHSTQAFCAESIFGLGNHDLERWKGINSRPDYSNGESNPATQRVTKLAFPCEERPVLQMHYAVNAVT